MLNSIFRPESRSPFVEQPETLVQVEVVQLVVVIRQGGFHLLPAPQNQAHPVAPGDVQRVVWENVTKWRLH